MKILEKLTNKRNKYMFIYIYIYIFNVNNIPYPSSMSNKRNRNFPSILRFFLPNTYNGNNNLLFLPINLSPHALSFYLSIISTKQNFKEKFINNVFEIK